MQKQKAPSKWKEMFSSKRISLSLLSINLNSVITTPVYAAFIAAEAIFPIYALAVIMQSQIYDKQIQDIWTLESYLNSDPILDFLFIEIVMTALFLCLILMIGLICYKVDSFAKVKVSSTLQSVASIVIHSLCTFLTGLYLHIQLRVFFIEFPSSNVGAYVALEILNAINFAVLIWIQLFLKRVVTLKIPYDQQPSAQLDYKNSYLIFLLEVGIIGVEVLLASFPSLSSSLKIISIVVLLFSIVVCLSKLFVVPLYNKTANVAVNFKLWTILSCSFIVVINSFDDVPDPINVYYIILLLPFMLTMSFLIQYHWEYRVMDKIRVGQSKMEMQHQYILHLLTNHVNNLKGDKEHQNQSLKYLFGILDDHNGECLKNSCLCHQAESIVWILNQRNDENQQIIELNSQDVDFLNNIQSDTLYTKEHFTNAPFTFNDYQDRKYILIRKKFHHKLTNKTEDEEQFTIELIFEDEKNGEKVSEDNFLLKIEPIRLKQAFFANFVRQYYEQAVQKFPESYSIKTMYAHFALFHMKNIFLCINILKTVDGNKLSFIERCNYFLCESLLIQEIYFSAMNQDNYQQGFQHDLLGVTNFLKVNHKSSQDLRKLDPESFLHYSRLQERFHSTTIELSKQILSVWQTLAEATLQVEKILKEAFQTALLISQTHETFKEMDEANKNKNEKIYYNFAIIHQQLLNDNQNYNLYIQKMKNIISMKKFIKNNFQITESFSDQSILLVSGRMENYGKIIECNKQFQRLTGYRWADLRYSSYELIMNDLIKSKHQSFVNEFNRTGEKVIIDKRVNQFLKRKNGYIIPVSIVVRNHFSDSYGFTFIAFFSEIQDIQIDGTSSLGIPTKDLMFLMCDNHEGRVYNVCKNTARYLGIKKHYLIENSSYLDFEIRIGQISPYFDINMLKDAVRVNDTKRDNLFYGIFKIDLNCISQRVQSVFLSTNYVNARFKIFFEQFQNKSFEYFTIVIQLIDKDISTQPKFFMTQEVDKSPSAVLGELEQADQILAIENDAVSSHTSSDSSKQADQIKSQNISMERTTPRSLKIVIQLLLLMFVTMITVSAINLYLSQSRQDQIVNMISVANLSSNRLGEVARTRLVIRSILNIANGYEPIVNSYSNNKTSYVYQNLLTALESLKVTEDRLQSENSIFESSFNNYVSTNLVPLLYLDQNGVVYTEYHTMSYLVNIYIQKLLEIYNLNLLSLKTKMNIQSLKTVQTGFKPTSTEQSLFFVIKNGNDIINYYAWLIDSMYNKQIETFSNSTIDQTQMTVLISIFTILAVFIVVTPIISMISDRQFIAVGFFVQIPKQKVADLILQTEQCLDLLMKEEESDLVNGQGVQNQESMRKSKKKKGKDGHDREHGMNESENSSKLHEDYSMNNDNSIYGLHVVNNSMINYTKQENTISEMDILVTLQNDKGLYQPDSAIRDSSFDFQANFEEQKTHTQRERKASSSIHVNDQRGNGNRVIFGNQFEKQQRYSDNQLDSSIPNSSIVSGPFGNKFPYSNPQESEDFNQHRYRVGGVQISGVLKKQQSEQDQLSEQDERKEKISVLNLAKKRRRINGVLIALVFVTCFCLYFMGSFFLTQNLYQRILDLYQDLNTIYNKDICMENVMSYLRETYAQNISYPLFDLDKANVQTASTYYLKQCLELENEYTHIRKKQDEAFNDAKQFMVAIESAQQCEVSLKGTVYEQYLSACNTWFNGIMTKGMSNAISIYLSNLNQYDLQFKGTKNRTSTDLINLMKNPDFLEMIDLKIYFMDRTFIKLKETCFVSAQNYFDKQLRGYIVFFCAFIVVTVFLLLATLILGLTRMRNYLWKINLSMKILPLDCLQNSTITALKKFFKS